MENREIVDLPGAVDDSRPFYQRKFGEIGIYIDALSATPVNSDDFGSEHYFMMSLNEALFTYAKKENLIKIKGYLEDADILNGVILENFNKGIVLSVSFNAPESLANLLKAANLGTLTATLQKAFVTQSLLDLCKASEIHLRARVWPDEYKACAEELLKIKPSLAPLSSYERDCDILKSVKLYQRKLVDDVTKLRDIEHKIDQRLGDLIYLMKQIIPSRIVQIKTLGEFLKYARAAMSRAGVDKIVIKYYVNSLNVLRTILTSVANHICFPLAQIHGVVEKDSQKAIKEKIFRVYRHALTLLNQDSCLENVVYLPWKGKILTAEQNLFLGGISLIPLLVEAVIDIDHLADEYLSEFPDQI